MREVKKEKNQMKGGTKSKETAQKEVMGQFKDMYELDRERNRQREREKGGMKGRGSKECKIRGIA